MIVFATIYQLQAKDAPWRYAVKCDYNAELVAALKQNIPSRKRKWCPDIRQWWFRDEVMESVLVLLERYCSNVRHSNGRAYGNASIPLDRAAAYRTLHLLPSAPEDLVKAAYRTLSKLHHPDVGGATSAMQQLNEAYNRLKAK